MARIAAQTVDVQCGHDPGRTQATLYESHGAERDEIATKMTTLEALKAIEDGAL